MERDQQFINDRLLLKRDGNCYQLIDTYRRPPVSIPLTKYDMDDIKIVIDADFELEKIRQMRLIADDDIPF